MPIPGHTLIPKKYLEDYTQRKASLTKARLRLLCLLTLALYVGGSFIAFVISPASSNPREIPFGLFLITATLAILYLNARAKGLPAIKINAYAFLALFLFLLTRICMIYTDYFNSCAALYLLTLFAISFTIPLEIAELTGIAAMCVLAFFALFLHVRANMPAAGPGLLQEYYDGLLLLAMGIFLCLAIKKKDNARETENYLLYKEIEAKNEQMRAELELATKIHKTLVPRSINTDLADIAVTYQPLYYMGGDYAKFEFTRDDRLFFIIADVTGHGVSAALMVNRLHTEVERLIREGKSPGSLLGELNTLIMDKFEGISIFLSAFAAILDFKSKTLVYSNRGHPTQYLYHITDSRITRLASQAELLGVSEAKEAPDERSVGFRDGDRILLFTDGVIETKNKKGDFFGEARLEGFIAKNYALGVEEFNARLLNELNAFRSGEFSDDIFILNIYTKQRR